VHQSPRQFIQADFMNLNEECLLKYLNNPQSLNNATDSLYHFAFNKVSLSLRGVKRRSNPRDNAPLKSANFRRQKSNNLQGNSVALDCRAPVIPIVKNN
jgi:hypothetical protein